MTDKARAIQDKINALQQQLHNAVEVTYAKFKPQMNKVFASRREAIAELIKSKSLPENFWALALVALLRAEKESGTLSDFLGPYDESLLTQYLVDLRVEYGAKGYRVTFTFKPNPFFEETELWAECFDASLPSVEDGAPADEVPKSDEEEDIDESWMYSGITWKEGHGPQMSDDDEEDSDNEEGEEEKGGAKPGNKRGRADQKTGDAAHQGPSILQVFSLMPPHPDDEDLDEEMDEEEEAEAIQGWEDEMEDRTLLMRAIVSDVHSDPVGAIKSWEAKRKDGAESDAKKAKAE